MKEVRNVVARIAESAGVDPSGAMKRFDLCASGVENSIWPEVAGQFSRLTEDGSPVEFTFSTTRPALRYTLEVAGPEMPASERLEAACMLMRRLGHAEPSPQLLEEFRHVQRRGPLRWGCWLGIRESAAGCTSKLYIEVPRQGGVCEYSGILPRDRLVMIGFEPQACRRELYSRKKPMGTGDLALLHPAAGSCLQQVWNMPVETALGFFSPGYSTAGGQVALFIRSGWIGGAAIARDRMLERERDGSLNVYRALIGKLPEQQVPDHGVLSVGLDDLSELRAGLSGAALARLL